MGAEQSATEYLCGASKRNSVSKSPNAADPTPEVAQHADPKPAGAIVDQSTLSTQADTSHASSSRNNDNFAAYDSPEASGDSTDLNTKAASPSASYSAPNLSAAASNKSSYSALDAVVAGGSNQSPNAAPSGTVAVASREPEVDEFGFPIEKSSKWSDRKELKGSAVSAYGAELDNVDTSDAHTAADERTEEPLRSSLDDIRSSSKSSSQEDFTGTSNVRHQRTKSIPISTELNTSTTPGYLMHTQTSLQKAGKLGQGHVSSVTQKREQINRHMSLPDAGQAPGVAHTRAQVNRHMSLPQRMTDSTAVDGSGDGGQTTHKSAAEERAEIRARLMQSITRGRKKESDESFKGKARRTKSLGVLRTTARASARSNVVESGPGFGSHQPRVLNWKDATS